MTHPPTPDINRAVRAERAELVRYIRNELVLLKERLTDSIGRMEEDLRKHVKATSARKGGSGRK